MSFSVDDLVASFNSSHIGQEALDLAALQAQLAETLFSAQGFGGSGCHAHGGVGSYGRQLQVQIPARGRPQHTRACNTPLARTPSSSFGGYMEAGRASSSSSSNSNSYTDDMEEDERMVEELLMPSSPGASGSRSHLSNFPASSTPSTSYSSSSFHSPPPTPSSNSGYTSYDSPSTSLFATTDPFYIAQLQASQAFSSSNNYNFNSTPAAQQQQAGFASNGRLAQSSPFALPQYHQMQYRGQGWDNGPFSTTTQPCATAF